MKKTYDVRKLCQDKKAKTIYIADYFETYFKQWKSLFKDVTGKEPTELDIFYAGYILSNPNVRDLYKIYGGKERDEKIELHRNDSIH